jgi:outer membrane protein TolC
MRFAPLAAAALFLAAVPAHAQPAPTPPAKPAPAKPAPAKPAVPTPAEAARKAPAPVTGMGADAAFDQEVAALFGGSGLTADEAARRSTTVSPETKRKAAELAEARARVRSTKLAYVPQITGIAKYTRLSDVDPFVLPPSMPGGEPTVIPSILDNFSFSAQLGVPLSDYLLRFPHLVKASKAGERAAELGRRSAELEAANDSRVAYYEWVRARLQAVIAERQLAQVDRTLEQVSALAEVQRASRADLLRVQAQRAQAELAVAQTRQLVVLREDQLRILIGAKADETFAIGEDVRAELEVPAIEAAPALADAAMGRRLEAKALDVAIDALGYQKKTNLADRLPRLDAFASANYDNPNQRIFLGSDEFNGTWAVGAQLSWKLNDFLAAGPTEDAQDAQVQQLLADRERLTYGVRTEVLATRQSVDLAQQSLATTAQGLSAAEESYRVRKELLAAERATIVELVDAETELTRARIAAIDARIDLRIALARLRHAAGLDVTQ